MQNNSYEYENGLCQPVEFATISAANWVRDQFFDAVRPEDDARTLEVVLSADTPKHCMDEIIRVQRESFEEVEGHKYGQEPLTSFEKSKLDFSKASLFHARSVKAIASYYGVLDWIAFYDPSLTTSEHIGLYQHESADGVSMREMPTEMMV
ncbi:hypothetical protein [Haladaptatus pallidirubidus]|uniref:Uncharacterized protein n=1 Tax=Haladaptatus pallidirubidus TaxID=1008152 RepID=A0AAV3UBX8_9EURY|nr:hypothetical protein [Haladaptatus pallidirubidus]